MEPFTHDLYALYVFRSDVGQLKSSVSSAEELNVLVKIEFNTIDYGFFLYGKIPSSRAYKESSLW